MRQVGPDGRPGGAQDPVQRRHAGQRFGRVRSGARRTATQDQGRLRGRQPLGQRAQPFGGQVRQRGGLFKAQGAGQIFPACRFLIRTAPAKQVRGQRQRQRAFGARPRGQPFVGIGAGQRHARLNLHEVSAMAIAALAKLAVGLCIAHRRTPGAEKVGAEGYDQVG